MKKLKQLLNFKTNEKQLSLWCNQTWPELYRYIYNRVQNREEAEDVTQETYMKILAKYSYPELLSIAYLKTTALNIIRDRWRRKRTSGTQVPLEEALLAGENEISKVLDSTYIEEALRQLPKDQQTVLELRLINSYSRAETAQKMNKSEDAIRGLQYRAIRKLRELMLNNLKEENRT